ncbi:hypothetical protein KK083_00370 [Fulvivirgaceae bacterium PWU4]|uniref:Uncharacterized protein n=1 Tax=Chryseosolibacter histidini TaxID=2782349 RepID=A0AAP2DFR0_9BACT|nr:hypothetical protein [Chryseosolibacter histidini]MBT1695306.1 hypothetical protein [Chryseosolibacter histidini]
MKESLQIWKRSCFLLTSRESIPDVNALIQGTGSTTDAGSAFAIDAGSIVGACNRKI